MVVFKMNSYFNAGYHDWQSSELHHYPSNRFCTSPCLTPSSSSQANFYSSNNGYHSYMHHNVASPQLSYANNIGYGTLPSSPSSHRYAPLSDSVGFGRSVVGNHQAANSALSFPSANLSSHLYGDHIVFGSLSSHYPVSGSELTYSEIASQPSTDHLVSSKQTLPNSPQQLVNGDRSVSECGECPASESNQITFASSVCAKLACNYEPGSVINVSSGSVLVKDNASQQSQQTFEDSSPSSTPDINGSNGSSSALPSNKAFFPWMKSYTGMYTCCDNTILHQRVSAGLF